MGIFWHPRRTIFLVKKGDMSSKRRTYDKPNFKSRLQNAYTTRLQHTNKINKRCVVLKAEKMQSACFFFYSLASIEQKKQSVHCIKEIQTHDTRFCAWYYEFCFCSHVLPGEKELDCFTRKALKGIKVFIVICMGLLFICS